MQEAASGWFVARQRLVRAGVALVMLLSLSLFLNVATGEAALLPAGPGPQVVFPPAPPSVTTSFGGWAWQNPAPQGNNLKSVSCPTTTFCAAIGEHDVIITYDGTSWNGVRRPDELANLRTNLRSISCSSPIYCLATGDSGILVRYKGGLWQVISPAGTPTSVPITAAVCYANDKCIYAAQTGNTNKLFAYDSTGAGTGDGNVSLLTLDTTLSPSGNNFTFNGFSCVAGTCVGVGSSSNYVVIDTANLGASLATKTITTTTYTYEGVSCVSTSYCVAVADLDISTNKGQYAIYNGTSWTNQTLTGFNFKNIRCFSTTSCLASGNNGVSPESQATAELTSFNGSAWASPFAVTGYNTLYGLSCGSTTFCLAVGTNGVIEQFNGVSWSQNPALAAGLSINTVFQGVSCVTLTFCVAVGQKTTGATTTGVVAVYNGVSWAAPAGLSVPNALYGVSCPTTSLCFAVGNAGQLVTYNGTWTASTFAGSDTGTVMRGVSCSTISFCMAVGGSSSITGVVYTYNGSAWAAASSTGSNTFLYTVDCFSTGSCFAGGVPSGGGPIFSYSSGTWSPVTVVQQPPAQNLTIDSISCSDNSFCMASGTIGSNTQKVLAQYDGTNWSYPALGVNTQIGTLYGVSCPVKGRCFAVGNTSTADPNNNAYNAVQLFNQNWTFSDTGFGGILNGVSCVDAEDCVAVGSSSAILLHSWTVLQGPDDGLGDTLYSLSYNLYNAPPGTTVSFQLPASANHTVSLNGPFNFGSHPLHDVFVDGGKCGVGSPVIIDGSNGGTPVGSRGIVVSGGVHLRHLQIQSFGLAPIISKTGLGTGPNVFQCTAAHKR